MKTTPIRIIHNQVDLILFEEGSFSPLNWLLKEGYLDYSDYQNWRNGKTVYLEDHFNIPVTEIIPALEEIEDYARSLSLESNQITFASTTSQKLHFCRIPKYERVLTTVYEPAKDRIQMDLFFDSAPACTGFDLIQAIIEKRSDDIPDLLTKLQTTSQEKYEQFEKLLTYEKNIRQVKETSDRKIKLVTAATPLAFEILGRFAYDFLTPLWRKVSIEIADRHFDSAVPEYHLSFTAFKGFQWQQVLVSIKRERNWFKQPVLLFRYAEASFKLNNELDGLATWFKLFILDPETAEQWVENTCNRALLSDWQDFSELDPELESLMFPAWILIRKPGLAKNNHISDIIDNAPFQQLVNLVCSHGSEINQEMILLRRRLQQESPVLFIHYMRNNK